MDSSFFLTTVAAAVGLFTLLRKLRIHKDNVEKDSSSSSSSSSYSSSSVLPPSSPSRIWTHHVFPSFRGEDVRRDFLSHIQMELQRKGITPFVDNEIKRGESIGPELIKAIRGSKIAIILLSRNYASSKWCLDELVEIMKCREEFGQTVMAIFYKVDPSDVKKLTGDFGKGFGRTCAGKTKEDIGRGREALAKVATIAGYHSSNWDNEAAMIEKIATDISNMLNNFTPSSDFEELVGMRAHLEKMEPLLCLDSDEVRMIGIWGPPGIGKTTIARVAYNQLSNSFQLSVFMDNIKAICSRPCSDDYSAKLQLQQQFMSQITNHKDMVVSHLGVASNRCNGERDMMQEWTRSLPRLKASLGADIRSKIRKVEEHLTKKFLEVRQRLNVLAEKSLVSIDSGYITMHSLLQKLGREIVCRQSIHEPGHRQFLYNKREICEVLIGDETGSKSVIGIQFDRNGIKEKLDISEKAFEGMSNLEFLKVYGYHDTMQLNRSLNYLSHKLRLLHWSHFPMTCLPCTVNLKFLVELIMDHSKLENLWEGKKSNLKWMDLSYSVNLKELPDLSTATNLEKLYLNDCSSLVKLPCTNGYTNNLEKLDLRNCSSLIELPWSFGNSTKLEKLYLEGCSKLEVIPTNINLESLDILNLRNCSMLKSFPQISTNIRHLDLTGTAIEDVPPSISLHLKTEIQEFPPCVKKISPLHEIFLRGCRKLVSIPTIWDSISYMDATDCESLEILECSFRNPSVWLNFANCFKLNQEARDLVIQTSIDAVLPGGKVPAYFTHRATGAGPLTIKLNERPLPISMSFKACILLVSNGDHAACCIDESTDVTVMYNNDSYMLYPPLAEHLYTFQVEAEVTSSQLLLLSVGAKTKINLLSIVTNCFSYHMPLKI
ncbi:BnaCnng38210D [Brassica napus]|uniref:BnaCnng38210D protein n=1 Tax=Brassica napus TaxID=3708 RepID=A0A078JBX2_BRANA|nr:BnaCnng38210D [Brassica napus]